MKRIALICLLSIFAFGSMNAQGFADNYYQTLGFSFFTDYYSTPAKKNIIVDNGQTTVDYNNAFGISFLSYMYRGRYNIYDISDELAVSASLAPLLGLSWAQTSDFGDQLGFLNFNLPLLVNLEMGAGSTYGSTAGVGGVIGAGIEFNKAPLFTIGDSDGNDITTAWVVPSFLAGVRYWSRANRLKEIAVKGGVGGAREFITDTRTTKRAFTVQLTFSTMLNY